MVFFVLWEFGASHRAGLVIVTLATHTVAPSFKKQTSRLICAPQMFLNL